MQRLALTISLLALVALAVAAPAGAAAPAVQSVTKRLPVREGKVTESKVVCPRSMAAVAGTIVRHPSGSTLRRSLPSGVRTWRFAFGGYIGARSHRATVTVRCAALNVPARAGKVDLNVNTVSRRIGVAALSSGPARLTCRSGYVPTAWGFDLPAPTTKQNVLPPEEVQVFKALATRTGYSFGVENLGAGNQTIRLRVRCLESRASGRAGLSHRWRIKRERGSRRIRSGVRTVRDSCGAGYVSMGLGHSIQPSADTLFRRSFDVRTTAGRWVFDNARGTERVRTQLLCLNTRSQFR